MNGRLTTGRLPGVVISTTATGAMTVTVNGRPARLAIATDDGQLLDDSAAVAAEVRACALNAMHAFWLGQGHLKATNVDAVTAGANANASPTATAGSTATATPSRSRARRLPATHHAHA